MSKIKKEEKPIHDQLKEHAFEKNEERSSGLFLPTGSTLLNLACSGNQIGGYSPGKMVNIIGDSSSGKTLLALTMFAEANLLKEFDNYSFIYDDVENALEFNTEYLFGKRTSKRIISPKINEDGENEPSNTIQDFRDNIFEALDSGPFVYVLDSFDALSSDEETIKLKEIREAKKKGKSVSGSYGVEKAKISSQILRNVVGSIKKSKSFLIIISQTRDDLNSFSYAKKTRSGGRALKFYATHEMWLASEKKLKSSSNRQVGIRTKVKITKNKITGKPMEVSFPIYFDYGVDDIGSCVDWMVENNFWKKKAKIITATKLEMELTRANLIKQIEEHKEINKIFFELIAEKWGEVENSLKSNRVPKYE
ncbi:MAG: hypothetical protein ACTSX6_08120 [Candidatus Heimdallarchaeaceae archaeon]